MLLDIGGCRAQVRGHEQPTGRVQRQAICSVNGWWRAFDKLPRAACRRADTHIELQDSPPTESTDWPSNLSLVVIPNSRVGARFAASWEAESHVGLPMEGLRSGRIRERVR